MVKAWLNGSIIPATKAKVSVFSHVVSYGTSVFEGIRAYEELNGLNKPTGRWNVWLLRQHIERLIASAATYRMACPYTLDELMAAVIEVVRLNPGRTYIRPIIFRDVNPEIGSGVGVDPTGVGISVAIGMFPWGKYVSSNLHHGGASVFITNLIRPPAMIFPGLAKGAPAYGAWSVLAKLLANEAATSEGLLLGMNRQEKLFVVDGSGMNLMIVKDGVVRTPHPNRWNILPGKTLEFLMNSLVGQDRFRWKFQDISHDELLNADEVLLSGTATEITPVTLVKFHDDRGRLTSKEIGNGRIGPIGLRMAGILQRATTRVDSLTYGYCRTPV